MKTVTKAVIGLSAAGVAYLLVQKSRNEICVEALNRATIHGFVSTAMRRYARRLLRILSGGAKWARLAACITGARR